MLGEAGQALPAIVPRDFRMAMAGLRESAGVLRRMLLARVGQCVPREMRGTPISLNFGVIPFYRRTTQGPSKEGFLHDLLKNSDIFLNSDKTFDF